jgi:hypothetical protein
MSASEEAAHAEGGTEEGDADRRTSRVERQFFLTLAAVILLEGCLVAVWLFA